MQCRLGIEESRELVVGYAAGTLDARARVSFERHIESCVECANAAAEQQSLWLALDEWRGVAVSRDFDRSLRSRIGGMDRGANWWRSWRPAVAAAGIVLGVGLWLNQRAVERPATPPAQPAQMQNLEHALDDMDLLGQLSLN
jgi:anti-sigma factor RsiW